MYCSFHTYVHAGFVSLTIDRCKIWVDHVGPCWWTMLSGFNLSQMPLYMCGMRVKIDSILKMSWTMFTQHGPPSDPAVHECFGRVK